MKWLISAALLALYAPAMAQKPPKLDEAALREAFTSLKDPDSLKVRDLRYKEKSGAWVMCGQFNAKNAMGGYVGYQRFSGVAAYDKTGRKVLYFVAATGAIAEELCVKDGL